MALSEEALIRHIAIDTVVPLYQLADAYQAEKLKSTSIHFIGSNGDLVLASRAFAELLLRTEDEDSDAIRTRDEVLSIVRLAADRLRQQQQQPHSSPLGQGGKAMRQVFRDCGERHFFATCTIM
jgi:hypothetical protein